MDTGTNHHGALAPASYRYEQLADLIASMVDNGTLGVGMRLPSVRAISE